MTVSQILFHSDLTYHYNTSAFRFELLMSLVFVLILLGVVAMTIITFVGVAFLFFIPITLGTGVSGLLDPSYTHAIELDPFGFTPAVPPQLPEFVSSGNGGHGYHKRQGRGKCPVINNGNGPAVGGSGSGSQVASAAARTNRFFWQQ